MPEPRKFYRTKIAVEVLTEDEPYVLDPGDALQGLAYDTDEGHAVGLVSIESSEQLTAEQMRAALEDFGSDASFFDVDAESEGREPYA